MIRPMSLLLCKFIPATKAQIAPDNVYCVLNVCRKGWFLGLAYMSCMSETLASIFCLSCYWILDWRDCLLPMFISGGELPLRGCEDMTFANSKSLSKSTLAPLYRSVRYQSKTCLWVACILLSRSWIPFRDISSNFYVWQHFRHLFLGCLLDLYWDLVAWAQAWILQKRFTLDHHNTFLDVLGEVICFHKWKTTQYWLRKLLYHINM